MAAKRQTGTHSGFKMYHINNIRSFYPPGTSVPAVGHVTQHFPVAAAQLRVLTAVITNEMREWYGSFIGTDDDTYVLPDIAHGPEIKIPQVITLIYCAVVWFFYSFSGTYRKPCAGGN